MPKLYLEGFAVHGCQLPLVIEHLLKVRNMPVLVSGVAVKPLQRACKDVPTSDLHPTPPGHDRGHDMTPKDLLLPDQCGHGCPHGPSS